jgi:peptide/nickel transport system permease protein
VKVARFLLARFAAGVLGLLVFASLMFFAFSWLVPGDFSSNFQSASEAARVRAELGLDRPLYEQYLDFMGSVIRLEFGRAYFGPPVREILLATLPWTLTLFSLAMAIALLVGIPLGRRAGWADHRLSPTLVTAATASSLFPPWLALIIANVGFGLLGVTTYDRLRNFDEILWDTPPEPHIVLWWLVGGLFVAVMLAVWLRRREGTSRLRWLHHAVIPLAIIALFLGLWLGGIMPRAIDVLGVIALPLFAFALTLAGEVILVVAAAMTGTRAADYSQAARAKGLTEAAIRNRHAGRATLLPAISRMAASLPYAFGGLLIFERAFASIGARSVGIGGVSSAIFQGSQQRNTPVLIGSVLALGFVALAVRLVVDLAHVALDPRIEVESALA